MLYSMFVLNKVNDQAFLVGKSYNRGKKSCEVFPMFPSEILCYIT